jgi:hypothetical protein
MLTGRRLEVETMHHTAAIVFTVLMAVRPSDARPQVDVPPDFAFRFEFGMCTTNVMDTFEHTFTHDAKSEQYPATSVPLVLPAASVQAIYEALVASRFFEDPSEFDFDAPSVVIPSNHYRLDVRSGGVRHVVSWTDGGVNSTPQAARLRALVTKMEAVIHERPEFRRFVGILVACA